MGANPDFLTCPLCNSLASVKTGECKSCGFVLPVEHGAHTHFRFPEVQNAYVPSGKWSLQALLLALVIALPGGAAGGALLIFAHYLFLKLMWFISSAARIIPYAAWAALLIVYMLTLVGHFILSYSLAALIQRLLRWTTHTARLRNPGIEQAVGISSGIAGCVVYTILGLSLPLFRVELTGSQPWVFGILALVGFGVILWGLSRRAIYTSNEPFCEDCQVFMTERLFDRLPTRNEEKLIKCFQSHDFSILQPANPKNELAHYCEVASWHCPKCFRVGYLDMETHLEHFHSRPNQMDRDMEIRLVYSALLNADDLLVLAPGRGEPLPAGTPQARMEDWEARLKELEGQESTWRTIAWIAGIGVGFVLLVLVPLLLNQVMKDTSLSFLIGLIVAPIVGLTIIYVLVRWPFFMADCLARRVGGLCKEKKMDINEVYRTLGAEKDQSLVRQSFRTVLREIISP
jgi:hypothetical protein